MKRSAHQRGATESNSSASGGDPQLSRISAEESPDGSSSQGIVCFDLGLPASTSLSEGISGAENYRRGSSSSGRSGGGNSEVSSRSLDEVLGVFQREFEGHLHVQDYKHLGEIDVGVAGSELRDRSTHSSSDCSPLLSLRGQNVGSSNAAMCSGNGIMVLPEEQHESAPVTVRDGFGTENFDKMSREELVVRYRHLKQMAIRFMNETKAIMSGRPVTETNTTSAPSAHTKHVAKSLFSSGFLEDFHDGGGLQRSGNAGMALPSVYSAKRHSQGTFLQPGIGNQESNSIRSSIRPSPALQHLMEMPSLSVGGGEMMDSISSIASAAMRDPVRTTTRAVRSTDEAGFKMVNDYVLMEKIGEGTCGKVKLGFHISKGISVAIKMVPRPGNTAAGKAKLGAGKKSTNKMESLEREIAVMKKLRHKHIVALHEVIDDPESNKLYIVMQYVDRGPIAKVSPDFTCDIIPLKQLALLTRQICAGLAYLHSHKIAHRDIKPENILVDSDGNAYLADFGVSDIFDTGTPETEEGSQQPLRQRRYSMSAKGTPLYMAPELVRSEGPTDAFALDMWALGVTLYSLSVGHLPFSTRDEILSKEVTFPEEANETLPQPWKTLLLKMLTRDPTSRATIGSIRCRCKNFWKTPSFAKAFADSSVATPVANSSPAFSVAATRRRSKQVSIAEKIEMGQTDSRTNPLVDVQALKDETKADVKEVEHLPVLRQNTEVHYESTDNELLTTSSRSGLELAGKQETPSSKEVTDGENSDETDDDDDDDDDVTDVTDGEVFTAVTCLRTSSSTHQLVSGPSSPGASFMSKAGVSHLQSSLRSAGPMTTGSYQLPLHLLQRQRNDSGAYGNQMESAASSWRTDGSQVEPEAAMSINNFISRSGSSNASMHSPTGPISSLFEITKLPAEADSKKAKKHHPAHPVVPSLESHSAEAIDHREPPRGEFDSLRSNDEGVCDEMFSSPHKTLETQQAVSSPNAVCHDSGGGDAHREPVKAPHKPPVGPDSATAKPSPHRFEKSEADLSLKSPMGLNSQTLLFESTSKNTSLTNTGDSSRNASSSGATPPRVVRVQQRKLSNSSNEPDSSSSTSSTTDSDVKPLVRRQLVTAPLNSTVGGIDGSPAGKFDLHPFKSLASAEEDGEGDDDRTEGSRTLLSQTVTPLSTMQVTTVNYDRHVHENGPNVSSMPQVPVPPAEASPDKNPRGHVVSATAAHEALCDDN